MKSFRLDFRTMKKALTLLLVVVMLNECSAFFVSSMAGMHNINGIGQLANVGTVRGHHGDTAKATGKHAFCEHQFYKTHEFEVDKHLCPI